jgi:hypothetical protein
MNCKRGDYAYVTKGELKGLVVFVNRIWWKVRASNETFWGVSSNLSGDLTEFACSDAILRPFANIEVDA